MPPPTDVQAPADLAQPSRRARFASVDTFRGLLLIGMVFTPSTAVGDHFAFLRHAEWDGITMNDWIFPAFLVTSGLSLSFLLRNPSKSATYRRLTRRLILLVVLGIAYNAYGTSWFDISELRFTGVLQMIGIAGAVGAAVVLASRAMFGEDKMWLLITVASVGLLAYGLGLEFIACDPVGRCSPYFEIDRAVLTDSHVYRAGGAGWDPEGLVLSIASSAFVLYGYSAGMVIRRIGQSDRRQTVRQIGTLAGACLAAGLIASAWMLPNKRLLTPSFALLVSGSALVVVCGIYLLIDTGGGPTLDRVRRGVTWPIIAFGRNAIIVYLFERVLLHAGRSIHIGDRSIETRLMEDILPVGAPAVHEAYAAVIACVILLVVGTLHRRRLYLAL
ncbi:heparan-alpha-glucosaminide N-acetyltransferase domain-containing protein [Candidatus Poriferisodalis sp.]|uniref:heparan-alpha-glucosaminide N-acetyltransferase domain-containing protein n=1 Tax=Candidatus Poriferisodalis sp. TaxID=3101277 RepID=UPI003B01B153